MKSYQPSETNVYQKGKKIYFRKSVLSKDTVWAIKVSEYKASSISFPVLFLL